MFDDIPVGALVALATFLREKGEYQRSLKILETLKKKPLSREEKKLLYLNLALVYKKAGFLDRAEDSLLKGIREFPAEGIFYYELGLLYRDAGKLEEAVEFFEKASQLKREYKEELIYTKLYLADTYAEMGRTDKALRILRKLDITVPIPLFYFVLSKLYYFIGENNKGFEKALQGMKLSKEHVSVFLELIERFEPLTLEKLEFLKKELGLVLPVGKLLYKKYIETGNGESALKVLEELVEKYPYEPEVMEDYLRVLWDSGRRKLVAEKIGEFLERLKKAKKKYRCCLCGFETNTFDWMCPKCRKWESLGTAYGD
jgi:lipopolysaccharide biosynthesis regulator YciM